MIITQMLQERVARQPAHIAFRFLRDGAAEGQTLTLQELETKARSIAAAIQKISAPGDSALLLYPPGVDFVAAFFGCLYAGIIAVPAPVPRFNRSLDQFRALL